MKKELLLKMNEYLSDCAIEYVKLHNLHWNVIGPQFKPVHEYLETLYNSVTDTLDEVAELIKIYGGIPLGRYHDYIEHATIKEIDNVDYEVHRALEIVRDDLSYLKKASEEIRSLADKEELPDIVSSMEDKIIEYNKNIWFINSMLR